MYMKQQDSVKTFLIIALIYFSLILLGNLSKFYYINI